VASSTHTVRRGGHFASNSSTAGPRRRRTSQVNLRR